MCAASNRVKIERLLAGMTRAFKRLRESSRPDRRGLDRGFGGGRATSARVMAADTRVAFVSRFDSSHG